jgi:hypothetical protein
MSVQSKISYLSAAIADAQELIRFIDAKTSIVISILGAFLVTLFSFVTKIIKYSPHYSLLFWLLLIVFIISLGFCVYITIKIILPTINPSKNVLISEDEIPKLKFFLHSNKYDSRYSFYLENSDEYKLDHKFSDYLHQLSLGEEEIVRSLTFELLKVSFVRNIKNSRLQILYSFLLFTTFAFICFVLVYMLENFQIKECLDYLKTISTTK